MSTQSYVNWLYHFLTSLKDTIPNENKIIFLINVDKPTTKKLKLDFPDVKFINENKLLVQKNPNENKVFKVTYLKGEFMEKAYIRLGEPLLWIDCTALINKSPEILVEQLEKKEVLLMRRDFGKKFGKSVYACEIFGMNDWKTIKEYKYNCEKRKDEWFADQLALCEIKTKKRSYIKFGDWSNFYYDPEASSWSDRGKTGRGILNDSDYEYTELKFIENLEKRFPGYEDKFIEFFDIKKSKPKILVHTDDNNWCYHTTMKQITEQLKDKYDFVIINDAKKEFQKFKDWHGDLVWARCSSKRHQKMLALRPDLRKISFSTVTTGGETGEDRVTAQLQSNKDEVGIICQNEDVAFRLRYKLKKLGRTQKIFILHNGVDTKKFSPGINFNQKLVVGFVGRTRTYPEDFMKGYSTILKPVCEELDLKLLAATNETNEVREFKDMPDFYKKIDVLVLLSHSEGHSNTINEAMASGVPVIAFPVGWHYEHANKVGIVWCQRNTVELYGILERFKERTKDFKELGKRNRKFAEKCLSWPVVAEYYDTTLKQMIREVKFHIPGKKDNKISHKTIGITKVKYIAEDGGMINDYGLFKPGKTSIISAEGYNYLKQNFPNKFEFIEDE